MAKKLGIVKEIHVGERRVACSPPTVAKLVKEGWEVLVETGAGAAASFPDTQYLSAGAEIAPAAADVWERADIVAKVRSPEAIPGDGHEADRIREGGAVVSFFFPAQNRETLERLKARKATVLAVDCIPRISRAQKVDALSSMANIAGYRAVVEAATRFGSFFTGQMTAAGKVPPAKVLIVGAGVAGLAAVAAARGLGAIVRAFDTRPQVREQVESLGGEFLEVKIQEDGEGGGGYAKEMSPAFIEAEMALFLAQAAEVNIVITTALIPGKPAPKLWTKEMVAAMKPGSVIVDLAAEQGGNCELTKPGEVVSAFGVTIIGYADMPSRMANVASDLYGTNLYHLLNEMGGAKGFKIDIGNDIVRGALIAHEGEITWPPPPPKKVEPEVKISREGEEPPAPAKTTEIVAAAPAPAVLVPALKPPTKEGGAIAAVVGLLVAAGWFVMRFAQPDLPVSPETSAFLQHFTVFILALFIGWQVVWNVTPALHTPLMSVTNAISGVIVVGGLLGGRGPVTTALLVAAFATLFATINIAGGFLVTRRMLAMFHK
ncbi:MAG: Re/Si-specific NAD(P)(+) transhydrogenase subunit alpha [Acidobacteria bacterium]|nr:Re/Si-specific NAD(P)(+) transhydrogenase subunit alpha [Acidobacteriota bacterium]